MIRLLSTLFTLILVMISVKAQNIKKPENNEFSCERINSDFLKDDFLYNKYLDSIRVRNGDIESFIISRHDHLLENNEAEVLVKLLNRIIDDSTNQTIATRAQYAKGKIYKRLECNLLAMSILKKGLYSSPQTPSAFVAALGAYQQVSTFSGDKVEAYWAMDTLINYLDVHDIEDKEKHFKHAYFSKYLALKSEGQFQESLRALKKGLAYTEIERDKIIFLTTITSMHVGLNELDSTLKYFNITNNFNESMEYKSTRVHLLSGMKLHFKLKDKKKATKYYRQLIKELESNPDRMQNERINSANGYYFFETENYSKAIKEYAAMKNSPLNANRYLSKNLAAKRIVQAQLKKAYGSDSTFKQYIEIQDTIAERALRGETTKWEKQYDLNRVSDSLQKSQSELEIKNLELKIQSTVASKRLSFLIGTIAFCLGLIAVLFIISNKNSSITSLNESISTLNTELNHRTANQISLAYELILDQRRQIGDEQAKASLERSESQLMALREVNRALAHRSDDLVRADEVLTKVAENLQAASPHPFTLDLQLKAILVHGNAASRSALILSELMSNSIKYAFPNTASPTATISISQTDIETSITYLDNGPGADGTVRGTGVGSGLIEAMLEDLDAEFEEIKGADGTGYGMRWWWG